MKLPEELFDFIKENEEYFINKMELKSSKKIFKQDYDLFREKLTEILSGHRIFLSSYGIRNRNFKELKEFLSKFSSSKILKQVLTEFALFCASIRVLELYSNNTAFFLAALDNHKLLEAIFKKNLIFQHLNKEMGVIFNNEDKSEKERNSSLKPGRKSPGCKSRYHFALKGKDFLYSKVKTPSGIESQNFSELSDFFIKHPSIKNFLYENRNKIQKLAEEYNKHDSRKLLPLMPQTPESKKLKTSIFSSEKFKRERESDRVVRKLDFGSSAKKPKIKQSVESDSQSVNLRVAHF